MEYKSPTYATEDSKREELKRNNKLHQFIQNEIEVAMDLMKDPEVVKQIILAGIEIAKKVKG